MVANKLSHTTNEITFFSLPWNFERRACTGKDGEIAQIICFFIGVLDLQSAVYAFFMHHGEKVYSQLEAQCNQLQQSANNLRKDSAQNGSIYLQFVSENKPLLNIFLCFVL